MIKNVKLFTNMLEAVDGNLIQGSGILFPNNDARLLKEQLKTKQIKVIIYNVQHIGTPSQEIVQRFGKHDLRTSEDVWGSIDDWLDTSRNNRTNSVKIALLGLGTNPEFPADLITNHRQPNIVTTGNIYFDAIDKRYNDVRGVDQSAAGDWVNAIHEGKVKLPTINFQGLTPADQEILTKEVLIYLLNTQRDKIQAYFISKILALYTHNREGASLGHIGGVNHVALPAILKEAYGIDADIENVNGVKPARIRNELFDTLPPQTVLPLLLGEVTRKGFSFNQPKLLALLQPHLERLKSILK